MSVITEGIRANEAGLGLDFGNYLIAEKLKVNDFESCGNIYKLRTHKDVTRLGKNGELLLEAVPGAAFHDFRMDDRQVSFSVEGPGDCRVTLGLEPDKEYALSIGGSAIGGIRSSHAGKLSFSLQLSEESTAVSLEKR